MAGVHPGLAPARFTDYDSDGSEPVSDAIES
jgi:hypothetical protein